ncbi:MAG TPA: cytochrome c peroxidase [Pyrinomonadaceae bacterium]|jgi:cytochrome c peroxidase|nr:cytochrome c peroxidase [Pyrinomonadaceae bacterium]
MTTVTRCKLIVLLLALAAAAALFAAPRGNASGGDSSLDAQLAAVLDQHGFTGRVGQSLEQRLGRKLDNQLADLGRNAFHDSLLGLADDNSCAGCHAAPAGFGDTQSVAIGVDNNDIVGPDRAGPRNQRRAPMVINNAFFPALMWNSRFAALSGDPFDNSAGFQFPAPEGFALSGLPHLLTAQAFIPVTEKPEMAGFHSSLPGSNDRIRDAVVARLNAAPEYRKLFGRIFPEVKGGEPVTYGMLARALAEFEFTLTFADAPVDRFARGQKNAMSDDEKRGALLFFGQANCVGCHAVAGQSNEMFSDFRMHVAGIPQIKPAVTNVTFDGPGADEDFGLEQVTGDPSDRYAFRTSPLRNLALQPSFFHNGAFTRLEDAVRYHLDAPGSAPAYDPAAAGLDADLQGPQGPPAPVLARLDPQLATPVVLSDEEFRQLVAFLRTGLQDPRATPNNLRKLIPKTLPSGRPVARFQ